MSNKDINNTPDSDKDEYEDVCMMCMRPESKAGKMFHLPGNICVCNDCMHKTMETIGEMDYDDLLNSPFQQGGETPQISAEEAMKLIKMQENLRKDKKKKTIIKDEKAKEEKLEEETSDETEESDDDTELTEGPADMKEVLGNMQTRFPNINFLNLSDLQQEGFPQRKKIKKRKDNADPGIDLKDIPAPHKIKAQLDEFVIGQEQAKKIISVAVYNHYKRVVTNTMDAIEIEKSNILMVGPTGCGKTYLVKTLARLLDVPLAITDATSLTEAGYIGDDIESVVSKLLAAADNDVDKAERGIIFIDEIDKIAKKQNTNSRDVSGESVQQGMLKLLEGAEIEVPVGANSKNAMVPLTTVNTRNILFICGGAFPGLDDIIKQRLNKQTSIGYAADLKDKYDADKNIMKKTTVDDIKKFGMIPEFVGRLPVICTLETLTKEMLVKILKEPKNAILKQYMKLLELDEVKLEFAEEALEAIAEKAIEKETGARALRAIIEDFMLDIMYEIPKDDNIGKVEITKEYIEGKGGPIITIRDRKNEHERVKEELPTPKIEIKKEVGAEA
jgi:ATP-dependent Clp protease ATP-binding subunit ClpX